MQWAAVLAGIYVVRLFLIGLNLRSLDNTLLARDVGPGDEVIVSAYGCGQTAGVVLATGEKSVFSDIDPFTGNLDPAILPEHIFDLTLAILATQFLRLPAEMKHQSEIAEQVGLRLIADGGSPSSRCRFCSAACCHGGRYHLFQSRAG